MSLRIMRPGLLAALIIPAAVAAIDNPDCDLDCPRESAIIAGRPEYSQPPITVRCIARLTDKQSYNILVANETKDSATHWELFTTPRDGLFTAYLPGRKPDHVRANTDIVDGGWHEIGMVMEERRGRLYVDGEMKAT